MARHNANLALLGEQLNRGIGRCGLLKPGIAERAGWVSPSIRRPSCSAAFVSSSGTTCAYRSVILKFLWPRCSVITFFGSERESVKCPIWRGLERLLPAAGCRLARQSLYSEPQIQRWRPVLWGRTFHASRRSWKESSHPIDSSWLGTPARLIAGTLGGTGIP